MFSPFLKCNRPLPYSVNGFAHVVVPAERFHVTFDPGQDLRTRTIVFIPAIKLTRFPVFPEDVDVPVLYFIEVEIVPMVFPAVLVSFGIPANQVVAGPLEAVLIDTFTELFVTFTFVLPF